MIKKIFGFIYKILSFINLQPALFIVFIGLILFLTGVFSAVPVILLIFHVALIISFIYAIIATIKALFGIKDEDKKEKDKDKDKDKTKNKKNKNSSVQIVEPTVDGANQQGQESSTNAHMSNGANNIQNGLDEQPKYYRVKQNPNLIMAEYSNRYELFKVENQKLIKIRTDYK